VYGLSETRIGEDGSSLINSDNSLLSKLAKISHRKNVPEDPEADAMEHSSNRKLTGTVYEPYTSHWTRRFPHLKHKTGKSDDEEVADMPYLFV
jgi:hypothetical protein